MTPSSHGRMSQTNSRLSRIVIGVLLACCAWLTELRAQSHAQSTQRLLERFCVDCHGPSDQAPAADLSLSVDFEALPARDTGRTLRRMLDAVEVFAMPPADSEQPDARQRRQLADGLRRWLSRPTLDGRHDPGRPVLRRLTRLEYNNFVRDLLGLETDVFPVSERLPFGRAHFEPQTGQMREQIQLSVREYGARYPVLLHNASLPGDSRAEHGFTNRGDTQSFTAMRLEQYIHLAGEIAWHPELLHRAARMQELLPAASVPAPQRLADGKQPLTQAVPDLANNANVARTGRSSSQSLTEFSRQSATAWDEDRGGVLDGETVRNSTIPGKGGRLQVAYGRTAGRVLALNPNEDLWFAAFVTADESSGEILFTNRRKRQKRFEITFQPVGADRFTGLAAVGVVLLSRRGEQGIVRVTVTQDDGSQREQSVPLAAGAGADNTWVAFQANAGRSIRRIAIDGSDYSGDYVLLDDLAFITRDAPNRDDLVLAEQPEDEDRPPANVAAVAIDRELASAAIEERLTHFLARAFRRPVTADEVTAWVSVYEAERARGGDDEAGVRSVIHAVLASPTFLYLDVGSPRSTTGPDAHATVDHLADTESSPANGAVTVAPLDDHALAARLSSFLWSSLPDDPLTADADAGRLQQDEVLVGHVRRLLADPRSVELSENFFVQWMHLQELWSAQPDRGRFPPFYSGPKGKRTLAREMFAELLLLFQTIHAEDRSVMELLSPSSVWRNGRLVQLLEADPATFRQWETGEPIASDALEDDRNWFRVVRSDQQRGGIVTSPAVLTLTSFPHRTSSIRRGVWILETVFNRPPPPPQVAVADIDAQQDVEHLSLRERVELHRSQAACAVCHDRIDPPGFALEEFDAIGRRRTHEDGMAIDASGDLPGLGRFSGAAEFQGLLVGQQRRFLQGLTEHLLSFALGRKLEYFDTPVVERIVDRTLADDCRLSRLVIEIVRSEPFRMTRVTHD